MKSIDSTKKIQIKKKTVKDLEIRTDVKAGAAPQAAAAPTSSGCQTCC